jgi:hypothetical protein
MNFMIMSGNIVEFFKSWRCWLWRFRRTDKL